MLDYITNLRDDALRNAAGTVLVLAWIMLAPSLMLLQSRTFYNTCALSGAVTFAAVFLTALLPSTRALLSRPAIARCAGVLAFVCGIAAVQLPSTFMRFVCACAQCALCAVLLQGWSVRLGAHGIRGLFATGFAATLFAGALWLVMLMTAVTAGIASNTAVFSSALLLVISSLPFISSLLFKATTDSSAAPTKPVVYGANERQKRSIASASFVSATLLCIGMLTSNFFVGATFNPHLYDLVAIISQGWAFAVVLAAAMCTAIISMPDTPLRSAPVWMLATVLIVTVAGMVLFVLGQNDTRTVTIAVVMGCMQVLAGLLVPFAVVQGRAQRRIPLTLAIMLAASGYLYMTSLGIHAKQLAGYSVDTLAPLIIICIAIPAVFSFVQGAMQMSRAQLVLDTPIDVDHLSKAAIKQIDAVNTKRRTDAIKDLPITEREREVVEHAARGLTYMQIADELGVSKKTVGYHLSNVYRKLGVRGRKELEELVNSTSLLADLQKTTTERNDK